MNVYTWLVIAAALLTYLALILAELRKANELAQQAITQRLAIAEYLATIAAREANT